MSISSSMALTRGGWGVLEQTVEQTFVKIIALSEWTAWRVFTIAYFTSDKCTLFVSGALSVICDLNHTLYTSIRDVAGDCAV